MLIGPQGGLIARVPESNQNLRDNRAYTFQYCVNAGSQYKLKIIDKKGDGLVSNLAYIFASWNLLLCLLHSHNSCNSETQSVVQMGVEVINSALMGHKYTSLVDREGRLLLPKFILLM